MAINAPVMRWRDLFAAGRSSSKTGVIVLSGTHQQSIPLHAHDFWELQLGERGAAKHETADGVQLFRRGTAVLLRPGAWHRKTECARLVSWACCFPPELIATNLQATAADPRCAPLLHHPGAAWSVQLDEATMRTCLSHLTAMRAGSPLAQSAYLTLVFDLLAGVHAGVHEEVAPAVAHPNVLRVLDAIASNPAKPWSVAGAAHQAGLSTTHFARCCRALTGHGPLAYLTQRRLEHATRLLLSDELSVTAIAAACGFTDAAYFARCFRNNRGDTPRQWLTKQRQKDIEPLHLKRR